jgi:hypothetical protein
MARTVLPIHSLPERVQGDILGGEGYSLCPTCDGGSRRRNTLGLVHTDEGVIVMKCFRVTCNWRGVTVTDPDAIVTSKKMKEGRVYRNETRTVDGNAAATLACDYGLDCLTWDYHGWRMDMAGVELVMPVLDPFKRVLGHVTRTLFEPTKRCYTYKATSQPWLDWWYDEQNTAPVVCVEDTLSACRLAGLGYNAVALLGTSMTREQAKEICLHGKGRRIVLALDRDAFEKALQLKRRFRDLLPHMHVLCLNEDIKDMREDDDIRRLLCG